MPIVIEARIYKRNGNPATFTDSVISDVEGVGKFSKPGEFNLNLTYNPQLYQVRIAAVLDTANKCSGIELAVSPEDGFIIDRFYGKDDKEGISPPKAVRVTIAGYSSTDAPYLKARVVTEDELDRTLNRRTSLANIINGSQKDILGNDKWRAFRESRSNIRSQWRG